MIRLRAVLALATVALLTALPIPARSCELLVLAINTGDTTGTSWTRGDVIANQVDGFAWSAKEGLPLFWKIKIGGVTVAQCEAYLDAVADVNGNVTKLRGKRLDYNSLSTPLKNTLNSTGVLTVTKTQADNYVKSVP